MRKCECSTHKEMLSQDVLRAIQEQVKAEVATQIGPIEDELADLKIAYGELTDELKNALADTPITSPLPEKLASAMLVGIENSAIKDVKKLDLFKAAIDAQESAPTRASHHCFKLLVVAMVTEQQYHIYFVLTIFFFSLSG